MASDQVLTDEILKIRKAIAELDRLIAKANPEQREKLKEIRLNLEMALEVAPNSCGCPDVPSRICALTGIRVE